MTLADYNNHTSSNSSGNNPPPSVPTAAAVVAQPATEPEINVNTTSSTAGAGYNSSKQDQFAYAYAAEAQIINDVPGVPASSQIVLVGEQVSSSSARPTSTSNPPGNCPDGGQWGVMEYVGNKTTALACLGCLCFGLFGLCVLACPQDEKDAYRVNGKLYDAEGTLIGPVSRYKFTPTRGPRGGSGLRRT